ncbi:MAG: hypothetical protein K2K82_10090 [Muribaculaceae bacterium]|nr:hypothetical protein [Muribaculaceae bacterium]
MKMLRLAPALITLLAGMPVAAAESEAPIITFKTTLYDLVGADNSFHFYIGATEKTYLDVDFGFGPVEVEVDQATYDSTSSAVKATAIIGTVGPEATVKIYGDASLIDYLDLEGVYVSELEMPSLTNLEILNLNHNQLKALDLTPFSKLQALYVNDNPFDESPLIVGSNKPELTILEISNIGALNQNFDISDYPTLKSFDAYATHSLHKLTPSGCPGLLRLSADCTSLTEIDVTKNPELLILNVSNTPITSIDISQNKKLQQFYCAHGGTWASKYKINSLDISNNPDLIYLMCQDNNLTDLDISTNPNLQSVFCNGNYLTGIDISKNLYLHTLNISNNLMDFKTMPLPREDFIEYIYYQRRMPVDRSYPVGAEIDMSSRVILPDSETWFALFERQHNEDGTPIDVELTEDYYEYSNGKITLLKETADSVYMAFANSLFPLYDIQTTLFKVKAADEFGKDNPAATLRTRPGVKQIAFRIGIQGATPEAPKTFSIDFGDGTPVEFSTTTNVLPDEANASGEVKRTGSMTIYLPEGTDLSALGIDGVGLTSINVTPSACITDLSLTNCQLTSIDLQWNRMLTNLDLSNNNLTTLDLTGGNAANSKSLLTYVNASNNKLTTLEPSLLSTTIVDLSNNEFTAINLLKASDVVELNLSGNKLTEVAIQDLESVKRLDLSDNELSDIIIANYIDLDYLNLSGNRFPLSTLPQTPKAQTYVYAPQKQWLLPTQAPTVNLTKQLIDGDNTTFTWHKADGTVISDPESIYQNNPGVFQLLDTSLGAVYCTFTNPTFPDFTGDNTYRTTNIEVAAMPTELVTSFRTLTDCAGELVLTASVDNASLYIDWEGNGALEQYPATTVRAIYDVDVHANTDVKVYAYSKDCNIRVMSITAGPMEYIDASPLSELVTFSIYDSKLSQENIKLPQAPALEELSIYNGDLTSIDFIKGKYPNLRMLKVAENRLSTIDLSEWNKLETAYLDLNELTSVKCDNPLLWHLGLASNKLKEIDLSGLPGLIQLFVFDNQLHTIDISENLELRVLDISSNEFDFNTLPEARPNFNLYFYGNQKPITAEVKDGYIVDLGGYGATTFRWFIDSPYIDEDTSDLYGEELVEGEEYTLENGVTTFLKNFTHIMCVMQNPDFPNLYLYTNFINVINESSIEEINSGSATPGIIYDLQGRRVANPGQGLYIRDGRVIKL